MTVEALLAKATDGFNAGRAFGPVIERDDCLIIPVAFVAGGGGGGDALGEHRGYCGCDRRRVRWRHMADRCLRRQGRAGAVDARSRRHLDRAGRTARREDGPADSRSPSPARAPSSTDGSSRDEDDAANGLAALQVGVGRGRLGERIRAVDDDLQASDLDLGHEVLDHPAHSS